MSRYFTLEQAEALIPTVSRYVLQAQTLRDEFKQAETVLQSHKQRVALAGGTLVNVNRAFALRDQRDSALKRLKGAITAIMESGCQLKDLDMGLVDFPTLYKDEEVLLCWRLGEDRIEFWHGTDEGFAGRKEIDEHFRSHHRGDLPE